jgi:hypothetical protein
VTDLPVVVTVQVTSFDEDERKVLDLQYRVEITGRNALVIADALNRVLLGEGVGR